MTTKNKFGLSLISKEEWMKQLHHLKDQGDTAFRTKRFLQACQFYTSALSLDHKNVIILSNRSAAYLSNGELSRALSDARECIVIQPNFIKGHSRLAAATLALGKYNESISIFQKILKMDKTNDFAKNGLKLCERVVMEKRKRENELAYMARDSINKQGNHIHAQITETNVTEENKCDNSTEITCFKSTSQKIQSNSNVKFPEITANLPKNEKQVINENNVELLTDFFNEVEQVKFSKEIEKSFGKSQYHKDNTIIIKEIPEKSARLIQQQRICLGTTNYQVNRIICANHKWYNLNPFRVLDIPYDASTETISSRYKALCLLLHPDKAESENRGKVKEAFEYVHNAISTLQDSDKTRHIQNLIKEGMRRGLKDYNDVMNERQQLGLLKFSTSSNEGKVFLEKNQKKAIAKIFAEVEEKRRDVEKRKWSHKQRERAKEDEQREKNLKEREFDKQWRMDSRVEKRMGNWKNFQCLKKKRYTGNK